MAEVHVMPGVERRDIGVDVPSSQVLASALDAGVTDCIVIGLSREGQPYLAAESANADAVVGKLMRAVHMLTSADVVQS